MPSNNLRQHITINHLIQILFQDYDSVFPDVIGIPSTRVFIESIFPQEILNNNKEQLNLNPIWTNSSRLSKLSNRTDNHPGPSFIDKLMKILSTDPDVMHNINRNCNNLWTKYNGNFSILKQKVDSILKDYRYNDCKIISEELKILITESNSPSQILTILSLFALLGKYINSIQFDWKTLLSKANTISKLFDSTFNNDETVVENNCHLYENSSKFNIFKYTCNHKTYSAILGEKIKHGANAIIYKAYILNTYESVIVASYSIQSMLDCAIFRDYNLKQTLLNINHPNLCSIYDVIIDDTTQKYYIIEQYLQGITLANFINYIHIINTREFILYIYQLLNAISYLHTFGIIHGDINPNNIIINNSSLYLIDYSDTNYNDNNTNSRTTDIINCEYWSPEKLKRQKYDYRSDIFSIGATIKALLPLLDKYDTFIDSNSFIKLQLICEKATKHNSKDRHQNLDEFIHELNEALNYSCEHTPSDIVKIISNHS